MNKLILKDNIDFKWLEKETRFGPITTNPQLNDGSVLRRILSPKSGSIVFLADKDELRSVRIISGAYEANGRTSNFWSWHEIEDEAGRGEIKNGYGFFYEPPEEQI